MHKQAGQWVRLCKQVKAAEERLRQAAQETAPFPDALPECAKLQPECAKQQASLPIHEGTPPPLAVSTEAGERQAQLHAIASDLLYWKGGLNVLRQAQLSKWRGSFKWQIEAKIEALQTEYAKVRAEAAKPDG